MTPRGDQRAVEPLDLVAAMTVKVVDQAGAFVEDLVRAAVQAAHGLGIPEIAGPRGQGQLHPGSLARREHGDIVRHATMFLAGLPGTEDFDPEPRGHPGQRVAAVDRDPLIGQPRDP